MVEPGLIRIVEIFFGAIWIKNFKVLGWLFEKKLMRNFSNFTQKFVWNSKNFYSALVLTGPHSTISSDGKFFSLPILRTASWAHFMCNGTNSATKCDPIILFFVANVVIHFIILFTQTEKKRSNKHHHIIIIVTTFLCMGALFTSICCSMNTSSLHKCAYNDMAVSNIVGRIEHTPITRYILYTIYYIIFTSIVFAIVASLFSRQCLLFCCCWSSRYDDANRYGRPWIA